MNLKFKKILRYCLEIERTVHEIYQQCAQEFWSNEQERVIWLKAARESKKHADVVDFAIRCNDATLIPLTFEESRFIYAKSSMEELKRKLSCRALSLEEALKVSIFLEERVSNFRLNAVAEIDSLEMHKIYSSLLRGDDWHVQGFKDAYKKVCSSVVSEEPGEYL